MSYAATTALAVRSDTTADFRAWATGITSALSSAGWVQTADTGQVTISSMAVAGANDTSAGYQIWRMADTLQSTTSVFLKLEFGRGGAVDYPAIWTTFGFSTDGAGNINSANKTLRFEQKNQSGTIPVTGGTNNCYFSGDTNRFSMDLWDDATMTNPFEIVLSVERTKDSNGNDTSTGLVIYYLCGNANIANNTSTTPVAVSMMCWLPATGSVVYNYFWPAAYPFVTSQNILGGISNDNNLDASSMASGGTVGTTMPIPFSPVPQNPTIGPMIYAGTDFTPYTTQAITVYGASHTYMVCGGYGECFPAVSANVASGTSSAYGGGHPMIRYE